MILITTEGSVEVVEDVNSSLDRVVLRSNRREMLESVLMGIELIGVSEGAVGLRMVGEIGDEGGGRWVVRMDRGTFALWVQFEVLNFLKYGNEGFVGRGDVRAEVEQIRRILGVERGSGE